MCIGVLQTVAWELCRVGVIWVQGGGFQEYPIRGFGSLAFRGLGFGIGGRKLKIPRLDLKGWDRQVIC